MAGYKKPKTRLHREFLYLNHDTILNSLSALEAGKVDEIIEKISEVREGGIDGGVRIGAAKMSGKKSKVANMEEELKRTRTHFSAFEEWHRLLEESGAFGSFSLWDLETRNEIAVGDTIQFDAKLKISPVQQVLLTFISFAKEAGNPSSAMKQTGPTLAATKKSTQMMSNLMRGKGGGLSYLVYISPLGVAEPKMTARLDDNYLIGGTQGLDGEYTIIGQVESLIQPGAPIPVIRFMGDTPATQIETTAITNALPSFIESGKQQGLVVTDDDITLGYPGVVIHPIAIYR